MTTLHSSTSNATLELPFDGDSPEYINWRESRLETETKGRESSSVTLPPLAILASANEDSRFILKHLSEQVVLHGYALYRWEQLPEDPFESTLALNGLLGLSNSQSDSGIISKKGLSTLTDNKDSSMGRYIPYTNRAMNWHTDGYYNDKASTIRCFTLHCVADASEGGELSLLDYELLLIAMYDEDPLLVKLLSHPETMMLPANSDSEGHNRPDRWVPVLYTNSDSQLGMRFTARGRNIQWRNQETQQAMHRVLDLIEQQQQWQRKVRLRPGEGVITRNVLHKREAFSDTTQSVQPQTQREMLRGRYTCLPHISSPD